MSIFLKVVLSKHSREVTINKGLKQPTTVRVILKKCYLLLQDSNKKILKLLLNFLSDFDKFLPINRTRGNTK